MTTNKEIKKGDFIRVRADHFNPARAGKDGMVIEEPKPHGFEVLKMTGIPEGHDQVVALMFGNDRHNNPQGCVSVGPELWFILELDLETLER